MTALGKITPSELRVRRNARSRPWYRRIWFLSLIGILVIAGGLTGWKVMITEPEPIDPPEAEKVLSAQEKLKTFGILIPAYLPKDFDRAAVDIKVNAADTSSEPTVEMMYRTRNGAALLIRQWVPVNRDLETLLGSRPIETKWGKGYLLTQSQSLLALWVDIGQLRVSLVTQSPDVFPREELLLAANTLGLASNLQVFNYVTEMPVIKGIAPPPPFEVNINEQGVQELNLTVTPGGYSPMRFAVKKGVPVKINFRALGEVGCANMLIIPVTPGDSRALLLTKEQTLQVLEFTPPVAGDFQFMCTNDHYRGVMTVRE